MLHRSSFSVCRPGRGRALFGAAALAVSITAAAALPGLAHEGHGHPTRIHTGTCEDLGGVAFRLNGVGADVDLDNAPLATPTAVNPDRAYQVMATDTLIDGSLDELLASDHAVMVYESDENMRAISCGNMGGAMVDDQLIVGLAEAGIPGHIGFAIFAPEGEQTRVSVIVGHAMAPMSASGAQGGHEHAEGEDDHAHDDADHDDDHAEEEAGDAAATPHA